MEGGGEVGGAAVAFFITPLNLLCIHLMNRVILIMGRLGWVICLSWPYWVR